MPEQGTGQGIHRIPEIGVIQDVEEFGPEAKRHLLSEVKLPLQGNIKLCSSKPPQDVAPEIPLKLFGGSGWQICLLPLRLALDATPKLP
jgi:hypothetical protein